MSDTHNKHHTIELPEGDLLLHAGDFSMTGKQHRIAEFGAWLKRLDHRFDQAYVIAGNHDLRFDPNFASTKEDRAYAKSALTQSDKVTYLEDELVSYKDKKIWGSPWSSQFGNWAFMDLDQELYKKYAQIPKDTNIVLSHGPPHGVLDEVERVPASGDPHVGADSLTSWISDNRPELVVFGHIHEAYGKETKEDTEYVNASNVNLHYEQKNPPITVNL